MRSACWLGRMTSVTSPGSCARCWSRNATCASAVELTGPVPRSGGSARPTCSSTSIARPSPRVVEARLSPLAAARIRPRLSRSLSRARWDEYRTFLLAARRRDYRIVSLESWVRHPESDSAPTLILRHDVDQHPRSALAMDKVERDL